MKLGESKYEDILYRQIENGEPGTETYEDFLVLLDEIDRLRKRVEEQIPDVWMVLPDEDGEGGIKWRSAFADHDMVIMELESQLPPRCKHQTRWPHRCRDCEDELDKELDNESHNLKSRIAELEKKYNDDGTGMEGGNDVIDDR